MAASCLPDNGLAMPGDIDDSSEAASTAAAPPPPPPAHACRADSPPLTPLQKLWASNPARQPLPRPKARTPEELAEYLGIDVVLTSAYAMVAKACPTVRGKVLSSQERRERGLVQPSLVYGEINFEPLFFAFAEIRAHGGLSRPGGVFYDLGSGMGKPVFAAAVLHAFDRVCGIELLRGLHDASVKVLRDTWMARAVPTLPTALRETKLSFVCADACGGAVDWSDATVAFANSTCFEQTLMLRLARTADAMREGSYFITFTKALPSDAWKVLSRRRYRMSWGSATVFVHVKVARAFQTAAGVKGGTDLPRQREKRQPQQQPQQQPPQPAGFLVARALRNHHPKFREVQRQRK